MGVVGKWVGEYVSEEKGGGESGDGGMAREWEGWFGRDGAGYFLELESVEASVLNLDLSNDSQASYSLVDDTEHEISIASH